MTKVAIIDYGMGNLFSVLRACEHAGLSAFITHDKKEMMNASGVILPGVGAFGDAMRHLRELDLVSPVRDFIAGGKPFLGICLGMQLLMSESEEFGHHLGLNVIKGKVVRFLNGTGGASTGHQSPVTSHKFKVPQVGWNQIFPAGDENVFAGDSLLSGITPGEYMYFVHSYYVAPEDDSQVVSWTTYEGVKFCSSVQMKNVFACQFHPEKSAHKGIEIYRNFAGQVLTQAR